MWIRALIVLAAMLMLAPAAQADEVRMFAVGNKHRIQDAVTYADFRNKMAALMDARLPEPRGATCRPAWTTSRATCAPRTPSAPARRWSCSPRTSGLIDRR